MTNLRLVMLAIIIYCIAFLHGGMQIRNQLKPMKRELDQICKDPDSDIELCGRIYIPENNCWAPPEGVLK